MADPRSFAHTEAPAHIAAPGDDAARASDTGVVGAGRWDPDVAPAAPAATLTWTLVPAALAAGFYVFSVSANLSASHDSVRYANVIESGRELYHPHHLLYFAAASAWLRALRALGFGHDGVVLVAALNAVFGALSLALFYGIVRRHLRLAPGAAWLATALPAFSFGVWFYSACVEVYVIPLCFLLAAAFVLTAPRLRPRDLALVGLAHAGAVLFHQAHVLFGAVVLVALWLQRKRHGLSPARALGAYLGVAAPTVALAYLGVMFGALRLGSWPAAWRWFTEYARHDAYWRTLSLATLAKAAMGFGRAIVGGHFVLAIPAARQQVTRALGGHALDDEAFLVRDLDPRAAVALLAAVVVLVALVLVALVRAARDANRLTPERRHLAAVALVWAAAYAGFFVFWEPENLEFWIPQAVCFWLVFVAVVQRRPRAARVSLEVPVGGTLPVALVATIAALLLLVNGAGSVAFTTSLHNDLHHARVTALARVARPSDLVILADWWIQEDYVTRFTAARAVSMNHSAAHLDAAGAVDALRADVARTLARGAAVYLARDIVVPAVHWPGATPAGIVAFKRLLAETASCGAAQVGTGRGAYWVLRGVRP